MKEELIKEFRLFEKYLEEEKHLSYSKAEEYLTFMNFINWMDNGYITIY